MLVGRVPWLGWVSLLMGWVRIDRLHLVLLLLLLLLLLQLLHLHLHLHELLHLGSWVRRLWGREISCL